MTQGVISVCFITDMSCRSRLAVLNEKLTTLERRVEYLEARVSIIICRDKNIQLAGFWQWFKISGWQYSSSSTVIWKLAFRMVTLSALRSLWCWTEQWSQALRVCSVNLVMYFQHTAVLNSASEFFISVHHNSRIKYLNALLYLYTTTYFSHIVLISLCISVQPSSGESVWV